MNLIKIIYDSLSMEKKKSNQKVKPFLYPSPTKINALWKNILQQHYTETIITER